MAAGTEQLAGALQYGLMQAAKQAEEQVDEEMKRLERLDEDDLEAIRARRIKQMKQKANQKQEWLATGHGEYSELPDEKSFFNACNSSKHVVCHFYRDSAERCKIVDKHMEILAPKHVETRFVKANADKFPFLTTRLNIRVIPTIALVKDGNTVDYIRGFDSLGGHDEFTTDMLEWRIAQADVITYTGDKKNAPIKKAAPKPIFGFASKKNIRGKDDDSSDSENDW